MGKMESRSNGRGRAGGRVGVALLALGFLGVGAASAQDATGWGNDRPEATANPTAPSAEENLSPEQMLARARLVLERLESSSENMRRQLREAREAKDVVKSLCLDDKLSQTDTARRSAADRVAGLEAAAQSGNGERARHEFAVISALGERADALGAEANQCIGEESGEIGDAQLSVTVDPEIADADPTIPTDAVISVPPVLTSPTR